jgi:hypothetical protein
MHSTHSKKLLIPILALAIAVLACNGPFAAATPQPAATLNALYTAAAQTLAGMSTQAVATQFSPTATLSFPTASPIVVATSTSVPPITSAPVSRCDAAAFVSDVTYPDGSNVSLGSTFTKIWRLKNIGTCTWTTSYTLVYVSGERFGAPSAVALPTNVGPGQTVDVYVNLTAPNQGGHYRGFWKLRNTSNVLFGIGTDAASNFFVDINVTGYAVTGYDFIDNLNYCDDANWWNASRDLPCPGTDGDKKGFVIAFDSPKLEDGKSYGKGLLTYPEKRSDGYISGKFEAVKIQSGDRFQALIGCEYKANDCDVIFRLQYQIGSGTVRTLGQWREAYEGQYYPVNIDLSTLAGEKVKFILTVFSNGAWDEDHALWINPRLTRQSSTPATSTPTATPTATATSSSPLVPTVTTQAVSNITTTTATFNGTVTALGVPNPTQHGFVWSTSANPTIADNKTTNGAVTATGAFTSSITGLTPGTQYYVRAYATNATGMVYGTEVTFITYQAPSVTTQAVTNITTTSATGNGTITALGVPNPTEYGIVWGTSADPTISTGNKVVGSALSATNTFTASITGLTPGTYHVRAYVTNAAGTVYGGDVTFTTP